MLKAIEELICIHCHNPHQTPIMTTVQDKPATHDTPIDDALSEHLTPKPMTHTMYSEKIACILPYYTTPLDVNHLQQMQETPAPPTRYAYTSIQTSLPSHLAQSNSECHAEHPNPPTVISWVQDQPVLQQQALILILNIHHLTDDLLQYLNPTMMATEGFNSSLLQPVQ